MENQTRSQIKEINKNFTVEGLRLKSGLALEHLIGSQFEKEFHIVGSDSCLSAAALITQNDSEHLRMNPNLVVVENDNDAHDLKEAIAFLDPSYECHLLQSFDVSLYSGLYPKRQRITQRLAWLFAAQNAKPQQIFISTINGLLQKCIPFSHLRKHAFTYCIGDEIESEFKDKLASLGYAPSPEVEDVGTYAIRGGIVDLFSPAHEHPIRIELFADEIESIRFFDADTQRSLESIKSFTLLPCYETLFTDENRQRIVQKYKASLIGKSVEPDDANFVIRSIVQKNYFHGIDFLLPYFYEKPEQPLSHFSSALNLWILSPLNLSQKQDEFLAKCKENYKNSIHNFIQTDYTEIFLPYENLEPPLEHNTLIIEKIEIQDSPLKEQNSNIEYNTYPLNDFINNCKNYLKDFNQLTNYCKTKLNEWKKNRYSIFISTSTSNQIEKIKLLLEKADFSFSIVEPEDYLWHSWQEEQINNHNLIHIIPRHLNEGLRFSSDHIVFLRAEDILGYRRTRKEYAKSGSLQTRTHSIQFSDLNINDLVVHKLHGVGIYEGLKVMPISGVEAEFIQIKYKDGDKLYLPVYRIGQVQKYSGPNATKIIDKLGGNSWEKTKTKVKNKLRDLASELLKIYAKRSQMKRPAFSRPDADFLSFENSFPFQETEDQLKAIGDVLDDMTSDKPMDRLICGDVGFGKTEIAMRAAFKAVQDGKQVAIIAPTTILTFQHFENFKKRFKDWPVKISVLNRFVSAKEIKKNLNEQKNGSVDIVIGTHRLLSKDIEFKNLGLLIIDEEQKFGVKHKEQIRKLKNSIDTLSMSATPIPRTLNMSLVGIRDLTIINTPPIDRLPTRTFVCKFDPDTIRRAILSEMKRGGQVFFLHNRVQSIHTIAAELREIVPEARIGIGHGQMDEHELEKTILNFFNKKIDILLCTTIIESGMDIPNANTMFIDSAHQFGLSQLYQLRGRVGRSKERAYCYLIVPTNKRIDNIAQERLRVIQENTALGSGIRIAQHDLELRGSGDILGENQSGHINAVGYELYMELLDDAVKREKGEVTLDNDLEPEINLRIPALIPDNYIPDIRVRLNYYNSLAEIKNENDLDQIEDDFRDQFGKPPEQVINLMGVMLIRKYCKDLGIKDLSAGRNTISLSFTERTPLPSAKVVELSLKENKKYSVTPDHRFNIRMNTITWPRVHEELQYLKSLC